MSSLAAFILVYIIGGLTLLPILLVLLLLHAHLTFPVSRHEATAEHSQSSPQHDSLRRGSDDHKSLFSGQDAIAKKFLGDFEKDVAECFFDLCREYVPGGVNGKPPVRSTPTGEVVAGESPSVYQSMYRSLFERRQASSSLDSGKSDANSKSAKNRPRNVFYVVLRHGHLMLYDDVEQVEVRHVIALANYDVDIYGGGSEIPEGELWIKRNAIRLSKKAASGDTTNASLPFYFFSDDCSAKEDFYFALLRNQERDAEDIQPPPKAERFDMKDIISLVQKLHSSEEQLQTRWLNALVGRLFLSVYKTEDIEQFVRTKITKKIARVKKPAFLSSIKIRNISTGQSAPLITNPRLKDLTIDGVCCVEADVQYTGNFRLELATTVRIDLGTPFKAREVDLVLAVVVKKLEGHVLARMKPLPSNRFWITFESMPQLDLSIEPIVSSRQITYNIILRAIESRIREVVAETIVLPYWDDTPFMNTTGQRFRGGIWRREDDSSPQNIDSTVPDDFENESEVTVPLSVASNSLHVGEEEAMSTPELVSGSQPTVISRKSHKATRSEVSDTASISSGVHKRPESPTAIRSRSFGTTAVPVLNKEPASSHVERTDSGSKATAFMSELSSRSQPNSPASFSRRKHSTGASTISSRNSIMDDVAALSASQATITESSVAAGLSSKGLDSESPAPSITSVETNAKRASTQPSNDGQKTSKISALTRSMTPFDKKQLAIFSAATAAKNWSWNTLNRKGKNSDAVKAPEYPATGTPEHPIGQGRPLPPPGIPLPPPSKRDSVTSLKVPKRKPVPPEFKSERGGSVERSKPHLPPRVRRNERLPLHDSEQSEGVLVVEAPTDNDAIEPPGDDAFVQHAQSTTSGSQAVTPAQEAGAPKVATSTPEIADITPPEGDQDGYGEFMENVMAEDEDSPVARNGPAIEHQRLDYGNAQPEISAEEPPVSRSNLEDEHPSASWHSTEEEARSKNAWFEGQEQS